MKITNLVKKQFLKQSSVRFMTELKTVFWIEKHTCSLLQQMQKAASTPYLKAGFTGHLNATLDQLRRLEKVFIRLDHKVASKKCPEMIALVNEIQQWIRTTEKGTRERDLGLIDKTMQIELLEIGKYTRLIDLGRQLEYPELTDFFRESLREEEEAAEVFSAMKEDTLSDESFITEQLQETLPGSEEVQEELEIAQQPIQWI